MAVKVILIKIGKSPYTWTILTILFFTIVAFAKSRDYGITWDEPVQNIYGIDVLHWYQTHGKDTSFLTLDNLRYYGPLFEVVVAFFQQTFNHTWYIRTLINILAGIGGIVAISLCCFEIKKPWLGFFSVLLLIFYPRFSGDIFANSKDIPLATAYCFVLWAFLRLAKNWDRRYQFLFNSILLGMFLGIATSIRIIAIIWIGIFIIAAFFYLTIHIKEYFDKKILILGQVGKQILSFSIIVSVAYGIIIFAWPYISLDPIHHFIETIQLMSHFSVPPDAVMHFKGLLVSQAHPPRDYTITWLWIATPIITLFSFIAGIIFLSHIAIKEKKINPYVGIILLAAIIPLGSMIFLDSTLYNALRQFLFVVPPLIIIAAYGLINLFLLVKKNKLLLTTMIVITILGLGSVLHTVVELHPYEYVYFNEFAGGLAGANKQFDEEYWGASYKACTVWLGENYTKYSDIKYIPVSPHTTYTIQIMNYLPQNFYIDNQNPQFYITLVENYPFDFENNYKNAKVIYQEKRFGVPLCEVKLISKT